MKQNYPNPFNPETQIGFSIPKKSKVILTVHNVLGVEVARLVDKTLDAGSYTEKFTIQKTGGLTSGIYFYRIAIHSDKLKADNFEQTKKMIFAK